MSRAICGPGSYCAVGLKQVVAALLGISAYQAAQPAAGAIDIRSPQAEQMRRLFGGQMQSIPFSQHRWYIDDVEVAERAADSGSLTVAALLMNAARMDGTLAGLLSTRTGGLVRLPKKFRGDPEVVAALELGHLDQAEEVRSVFDEMFPPSELALMAADGIFLGVAVGELVPVEGRDYPVLVRLNPMFLTYQWNENRWYFNSAVFGRTPITPGDGRWVLHTPGGRQSPWQNGLWRAIGLAFIRKSHAQLNRDIWEAKLAHPARVAKGALGASEESREGFFRQLLGWGKNTVIDLPPGWEVQLIESNGRGCESFRKTIEEQNTEYQIAIAGQTVTTDGGTGFANADIHKSIRADLIKETADSLAFTINTQGIPSFVVSRFGEDRLSRGVPVMEWDVTPPVDRFKEAQALTQAGQAITTLDAALRLYNKQLNIEEMAARFGIPITDLETARVADAIDATPKSAGLRVVGKENAA